MINVQMLRASLIFEPLELSRSIDRRAVEQLAESIKEIGLLNPILVRPKQRRINGGSQDAYEILAGVHRFRAMFNVLNMTEIPACILSLDSLHTELAAIDENLCRAELSPADRARCTARRKEIYEELHPEVKAGALRAAGMNAALGRDVAANLAPTSNVLAFAADAAAKTGRPERTIQRDAERGVKVASDVLDRISGTHLDKGFYLDKLKRLPVQEQRSRFAEDFELGLKKAAIEFMRKRPEDVQEPNVIELGDRLKPVPSVRAIEQEQLDLNAADDIREEPEADLDTFDGRAHAINDALSTLGLSEITGREYWTVFHQEPARTLYAARVRSAHAKLTEILHQYRGGAAPDEAEALRDEVAALRAENEELQNEISRLRQRQTKPLVAQSQRPCEPEQVPDAAPPEGAATTAAPAVRLPPRTQPATIFQLDGGTQGEVRGLAVQLINIDEVTRATAPIITIETLAADGTQEFISAPLPFWCVIVDGHHPHAKFPKTSCAFDQWFTGWYKSEGLRVLADWREAATADGGERRELLW